MADLPNRPKCNSEYTYEDGNGFVCSECAHEVEKAWMEYKRLKVLLFYSIKEDDVNDTSIRTDTMSP